MLNSTVHDDDYDDCDDDAAIMLVVVILVDALVYHDIRYLMFNTITAATAMMIMVALDYWL